MNLKRWSMIGIAIATLSAGLNLSAQEEDAKLESFFKQYLEQQFRQQPTSATSLGDHRFDGMLDDVSPAARRDWLKRDRDTLSRLPKEVDYAKLTRDGQIDFEIFQHELTTSLWLTKNTHPFEEDPRAYGAYISDSIYGLLTQSTLPKETNITHCLERMAKIPCVIATARQTLTHPPKAILQTAIHQNRGAISFYETDLFQFAGDTPQLPQLKTAAARIASDLKDYQKFLEGDLTARASGGWRLGRKKFTRKLDLVLDAGMTASQVLSDAETEFARVQRDMYVIARQLWSRYFPGQPLPPDDPAGRRETITKVIDSINKEHGKPEDLVADARATVENIKKFIRENDVLRLPDPDRCQVIEMPEFNRGNSAAYMQNAPPLDPDAPSFYAVSPPPADWDAKRVESFLEEYNHHMLQILTIHEAYPGHYVQLAYAARVPSLIRKVYGSGAYIEGWAVYGEQNMLDMGYGNGDLRLRMMQLKFYLRAVANAILDHKMHCDNMTDGEAMKMLVNDCFQSEGEAKLKIIRAKQSSTQLSTYFVGRMGHYRLRQKTERESGPNFSIGRYHEAVISCGSVPLKYLPELVKTRLSQPR
ncbi:MAG TPA: DUF885 domain-containing protein [Verrucomicrobiae bacterium]|jgi:uncharacterized protein (DUF885 family)